jgi:hypothetical protein
MLLQCLDRSFFPTGYKSLQPFHIHLGFPWDLQALLDHVYLELLAHLEKRKNRSILYFTVKVNPYLKNFPSVSEALQYGPPSP